MMGVCEAVLRPLNMAQGADAQVYDGQLGIRLHPTQPWVAAMRIPTALAARARRWVTTSVHAATEGTAPVTASPTPRWRRAKGTTVSSCADQAGGCRTLSC